MEQGKVVRSPSASVIHSDEHIQMQQKPLLPEDAARAFYARVTGREDIRELLKRLSDR
jgi:hypothetical protein